MKSIRTSFTLLTVFAVVISVSIATVINLVSIRRIGNTDADQMLLLMCETGEKNLNAYFDSVKQSLDTVSTLVEEDLRNTKNDVPAADELTRHVDHSRNYFEKAVRQTTGVVTYYYRIDPAFSDDVKGFWYNNTDDKGSIVRDLTDITQYDTEDTGVLTWFTVPKATGRPIWLSPYIADNSGARVISYNVPIHKNDTFVGVVGMEIDYSLMTSVVNNIKLYENGYALMTDGEGNLIYHPLMDVEVMTDKARQNLQEALHTDEKKIHFDFEGENMVGTWLPLDNGMRIYVVISMYEIYSRWQNEVVLLLVASLLILMIVSIFTMRYTKRLIRPLWELTNATDKMRKGDYNINLSYNKNNEVGVLTQTFSSLVDNLNQQIHARSESEQANIAKSQFLSSMSHEIRTPITTILGMNDIIHRDSRDEHILRCSDNIRKAGTSLLGIISDILDFSKIEAGKMELVMDPYPLKELIGDLHNMVRFRAQDKGLELRLDVDPGLPSVLVGDELRIKQVITNLLTNAVKYTESGSVTLTIKLDKSAGKMARLYVAVTDTGIGIHEDEMDLLFGSFNRLDTKRTHTIEGTGLGLSIVRRLLDMMGSDICVKSRYNEGSTFSFYLDQEVSDPTPIGKFDEVSVAHMSEAHLERFTFVSPDSHVLLVDDTQMNLEVIRGILKPTQIKIDVAVSGKDCIKKFLDHPYDLVFLDYRMPHMDGVETLTAMYEKAPAKTKSTPVISLTANAVSGEKERMIEAGFTDYLTKPIKISDMNEMLIKYLPDALVTITDDAEETDGNPLDEIPPEAFKYSWLNPNEGLEYSGSAFMYLKALELYTNNIDEKASLLQECLDKEDIKLYTVTIHALKSTSRVIGIDFISEQARFLEQAGKNEDIDLLREETPKFLKDYRGLKEKLTIILEKSDI